MTRYVDIGGRLPDNIFEGFLTAIYEIGTPIKLDRQNRKVLYSATRLGKKIFEHAMDDFEKFHIKENIDNLIWLYRKKGHIDENDVVVKIPTLNNRKVSDCSWFLADVYDWLLNEDENPKKRITKNGNNVEFDNLESPDS